MNGRYSYNEEPVKIRVAEGDGSGNEGRESEINAPKLGRCQGCGEWVEINEGATSHTRTEWDSAGCPVPVLCGPVTPVHINAQIARLEEALAWTEPMPGEERPESWRHAFDVAHELLDLLKKEVRRE